MGKHLLRDDKECQNCGDVVEKKFCPNCGQKNTETRQSFGHLFGHFIEDLTHYDTAFWKTIKYLLFRPARLTQEYLIGKRQSYVPPVKLYIFISFITFFLPAVLPDVEPESASRPPIRITQVKDIDETVERTPRLDQEEDVYPNFGDFSTNHKYRILDPMTYRSIKEMDSIEALKPDSLRLNAVEYRMAKKLLHIYSHNTPEEVGSKFRESFWHNTPKALFIYLPIFAFWLWFFHGKKRWYFFDHSIFTLHYFSFLLLVLSFMIIIDHCNDWINATWFRLSYFFLTLGIIIWYIYYFYRAHRKMYRESWIINFIKSSIMFVINIISIIVLLVMFGLFTLYNLH